jgi:hypothetical protein
MQDECRNARFINTIRVPSVIGRHGASLGVTTWTRSCSTISRLEILDKGVPLAGAKGRVAQVAELFRYYAGWPTKICGTVNPIDPGRFQYMLREPMGVYGLIKAWNAPLVMAASKLAPALACGNTAVLKPAEQSPLTTLRLAELIEEVPAGLWSDGGCRDCGAPRHRQDSIHRMDGARKANPSSRLGQHEEGDA